MINKKFAILFLVVLAIIGLIVYLEGSKAGRGNLKNVVNSNSTKNTYKEIINPSGYINTDGITIGEQVGKRVIMVDFWTYSCINCQRTLPYLNSWHEKYSDKGLIIIGIHTPEFEFEKDINNVRAAVKKYGVRYPVVLDNDYSTWDAYGNRYWPRKYLIDLTGNIVYDHIGEGAYKETERKIQELLNVKDTINQKSLTNFESQNNNSPETYLGSKRSIASKNWSLVGDWEIQPEYATNKSIGAKIIYKYMAKEVYLVASGKNQIQVRVKVDGKLVGDEKGEDVGESGILTVNEDRLYKIIQSKVYGEHTLELEILSPGLKTFAFTFG